MKSISLSAAVSLTGRSERTLWRWIANGTVSRVSDSDVGKTMLDFDSVAPHLRQQLAAEELDLVERADSGGGAEEQTELALLILANGKPESAIYWLEIAAKQGSTDAMHWLGRCYLEGQGLAEDRNLGLMWLANAAAHGHLISQRQIESLCEPGEVKRGSASSVG